MTTRTKTKSVLSEAKYANSPELSPSQKRLVQRYDCRVKEVPFGLSHTFHSSAFPLMLMIATTVGAPVLSVLSTNYEAVASVGTFSGAVLKAIELLPQPSLIAAKIVGCFALLEWLLLTMVPGATYYGPFTPTGNRPQYRLNGLSCYFLTHAILGIAGGYFGLFNLGIVYDHLGEIIAFLNYFSLAMCVILYFKGMYAPDNADSGSTGNFIMDFFWGVELHPRLFGVSLKQFFNCRFGMMAWSVMLCSYMAKQYELYGFVSNSMMLSVLVQVVYIVKFFRWEGGYFASMDITHDRFGYYIYWGVTVWVPSFYTLTGMWLVKNPIILSNTYFWSVLILGLVSVYVNYAADEQRQRVRLTNGQCTVWGKKPELILAKYKTTDGRVHENLLLTSGYWGIARHFHYVPELLLALCWSLPAQAGGLIPYMYFLFLCVLLVHRTGRDEVRCKEKYTVYWEQYKKCVPFRMIPGIF